MSRMVIDDEMWARLEPLLPKPKGRPGKDDRLFIEVSVGSCELAHRGAICRLIMVLGKRFTIDITTGLRKGTLKLYWMS